MEKETRVSDDLTVSEYGDTLGISSLMQDLPGEIIVDAAELPALLNRLQEAAEAMGIATAQGALLDFAKKFQAFTGRDDYTTMDEHTYAMCINELADSCTAAIAKAEQ